MKLAILILAIAFASGCALSGNYSPEYQRADSKMVAIENEVCGNYEMHYREIMKRCRAFLGDGVPFFSTVPSSFQGELFHDTKNGTIWITTGGYVCDISDANGKTKIVEWHYDYPLFRKFSNSIQEYITTQKTKCP